MRFKLDENLPVGAADILHRADHEAETVHDERLVGASDSQLAKICQQEGRVLVTLDLDFADIRTYPPAKYPGLIVLRPKLQSKPHVLDLLRLILPLLKEELLIGQLWIVDHGGVRIRPGEPPEKPR